MPLEMPEEDDFVGKCGLPPLKHGADGECNRPGVGRIAVGAETDEDDPGYYYTSQFRVVTYLQVKVAYCQDHKEKMARDFTEAQTQVAEREAKEAQAAAKIHDLEDQLREAKRAYPGTWHE